MLQETIVTQSFQETLRRGKKQREEEGDEGGGAGYVFGDF